jgi:hypothetical protein
MIQVLKSYWENGIYHVVVDFDENHGATYKFDSIKTHEQVIEFATEDYIKYQLIQAVVENEETNGTI